MLKKGYVISFTFIGGSEDEMDDLVEGLSFARSSADLSQITAPMMV